MNDEERPTERVAADSDELLSEVRELRTQEERKRHALVSSHEFHTLADDVERRARRIWQTAADERRAGNRAKPDRPTTTEEVASSGDGARPLDGGKQGKARGA